MLTPPETSNHTYQSAPQSSLSNPWILRKPEVGDYFTYKWKVNKREHINPQDYGLRGTKFRHFKVLDLLDEDGVKPLETLKDELGLLKLHYLSYA